MCHCLYFCSLKTKITVGRVSPQTVFSTSRMFARPRRLPLLFLHLSNDSLFLMWLCQVVGPLLFCTVGNWPKDLPNTCSNPSRCTSSNTKIHISYKVINFIFMNFLRLLLRLVQKTRSIFHIKLLILLILFLQISSGALVQKTSCSYGWITIWSHRIGESPYGVNHAEEGLDNSCPASLSPIHLTLINRSPFFSFISSFHPYTSRYYT